LGYSLSDGFQTLNKNNFDRRNTAAKESAGSTATPTKPTAAEQQAFLNSVNQYKRVQPTTPSKTSRNPPLAGNINESQETSFDVLKSRIRRYDRVQLINAYYTWAKQPARSTDSKDQTPLHVLHRLCTGEYIKQNCSKEEFNRMIQTLSYPNKGKNIPLNKGEEEKYQDWLAHFYAQNSANERTWN